MPFSTLQVFSSFFFRFFRSACLFHRFSHNNSDTADALRVCFCKQRGASNDTSARWTGKRRWTCLRASRNACPRWNGRLGRSSLRAAGRCSGQQRTFISTGRTIACVTIVTNRERSDRLAGEGGGGGLRSTQAATLLRDKLWRMYGRISSQDMTAHDQRARHQVATLSTEGAQCGTFASSCAKATRQSLAANGQYIE